MNMKTTGVLVLGGLALAACRDPTTPMHVRDDSWGPDQRIVYFNVQPEPTYSEVYGDLPPYGSLDYVCTAKRNVGDIEWSGGELIMASQEAFADYVYYFEALRRGQERPASLTR